MSLEISKSRLIKNVGLKPHNLPPSEIHKKIDEVRAGEELGILVLKPGSFSIDHQYSPLQDRVEGLLSASGLNVIATSCVNLAKAHVHQLYPDIFNPIAVADSIKIERLRTDLETYMADCVFSYLLRGNDTMNKIGIIKRSLRKSMGYANGSINVRNAIHVPDSENLYTDIDILFACNNCQVCPKNKA